MMKAVDNNLNIISKDLSKDINKDTNIIPASKNITELTSVNNAKLTNKNPEAKSDKIIQEQQKERNLRPATRSNYNDKIKNISSYFGISVEAAKYMYHRRRRGFPWKNENDGNFLKWNIQLQNALIKADNLAVFDWTSLKFNNDVNTLKENGIIVDEQPKTIYRNKSNDNQESNKDIDEEEDDGGGWTVVTKKENNSIQKQILRNLGFLTKKKNKLSI